MLSEDRCHTGVSSISGSSPKNAEKRTLRALSSCITRRATARDRGRGGQHYSSLELLDRCRRLSNPITLITRLRLGAALYEPAAPHYPGQIGRPRSKASAWQTFRSLWKPSPSSGRSSRSPTGTEKRSARLKWPHHCGLAQHRAAHRSFAS
jgi:hypothetical protein